MLIILKQPFSSHLAIAHWYWSIEGKLGGESMNKVHTEEGGNIGWGTRGEEGGWLDGEIKRDDGSVQTVGGTMTWKSRTGDHTPHWHIWRGAKYPDLLTRTHTHKDLLACMQTHTALWMHTNTHRCAHTHTQRGTQPEALQQREASYELNIWTQASSQLCLHWLTFSGTVDLKNTIHYK